MASPRRPLPLLSPSPTVLAALAVIAAPSQADAATSAIRKMTYRAWVSLFPLSCLGVGGRAGSRRASRWGRRNDE